MLKDYDLRLSYLELKDLKIDSKIITKSLDLEIFKNELEQKYKKDNINIDLVHRASRDGNLFDSLNSLITRYNYKNLLILFQTKKGLNFGIFINDESNNKRDNYYNYDYDYYNNQNSKKRVLIPKSFFFSFSNNQIYYLDNYEKLICFNNVCPNEDNKCLINFCSNDLLNSDKNMNDFITFKNISFGSMNESNKYFNLQEIEVFQVNYNN